MPSSATRRAVATSSGVVTTAVNALGLGRHRMVEQPDPEHRPQDADDHVVQARHRHLLGPPPRTSMRAAK